MISDDETKFIIDNYFIQEFKNENYYSGTLNGITEMIKMVSIKYKKFDLAYFPLYLTVEYLSLLRL